MTDRKDTDPIVRLFASVDLIGATSYKNKFSEDPKNYSGGKPHWFKEIGDFYSAFKDKLKDEESQLSKEFAQADSKFLSWEIVKAIGDELLLTCLVENRKGVYRSTLIFRNALRAFNQIDGRKLKVKGSLWLAGFPINNAVAPIPSEKHEGLEDYLGPSIDAGFRIAKHATLRKLVISVDLALLLTHEKDSDLKFYYDGSESLKGILSDKPYPLIWIENDQNKIEEELIGIKKDACDIPTLHCFCRKFVESVQETSWLILPYFTKDTEYNQTASWHQRIREEIERSVDETLGDGASDPITPSDDSIDGYTFSRDE